MLGQGRAPLTGRRDQQLQLLQYHKYIQSQTRPHSPPALCAWSGPGPTHGTAWSTTSASTIPQIQSVMRVPSTLSTSSLCLVRAGPHSRDGVINNFSFYNTTNTVSYESHKPVQIVHQLSVLGQGRAPLTGRRDQQFQLLQYHKYIQLWKSQKWYLDRIRLMAFKNLVSILIHLDFIHLTNKSLDIIIIYPKKKILVVPLLKDHSNCMQYQPELR